MHGSAGSAEQQERHVLGDARNASVVAPLETLQKTSAVAEELDFKVLRERVRSTLPEFAEQPDFLGLFRFVVDMGGDDASFVEGLRLFHQKFVDPKIRRLALAALTAVCEIPPELPT